MDEKFLEQFPYKMRFDNIIVKASVDADTDKYLSKASLNDLKKLDIDKVVDLENNIDLIGTMFNAAVINRLNRNGDGISTESALAIKDLFVHKPHNLEHKANRIVGHIVKAGWSSFGDNVMLTDEQVKDTKVPFNLVLGGVVYRMVDEKFADLLVDSSDASSPNYNLISTSWELAFAKYVLLAGSKNVADGEIISDPAEVEKYKSCLRCNGGEGKLPDGRSVGRLMIGGVGSLLPVGMAFTSKPAAEVTGVLTQDWTDLLSPEEKQELANESTASLQNNEKNSSQTIESDVKNNSQANTPMKITNIKELLAAASSKEGLSEASAAEFIATQIELKSKEWEAAQNAEKNAVKDATAKATQLETDLSKATSKIAELSTALESIQVTMAAKQKEEDFNTRMTAIASEYELTAKDSELIAKQIKNLDEKSYASWFETFSVFAEAKSKKSIAAVKEVVETAAAEAAKKVAETAKAATVVTEVSKASTEATKEATVAAVATAALDTAKEAANQQVTNTTEVTVPDAKAQWADAFKQSMTISY